jgi:hypothetical protein
MINECANVAVNWLGPEMKRWEVGEAALRKFSGAKSTLRKASVEDKGPET